MNGLQLYARYVGISMRSQLQYRANLILMSVGQLLIAVVEFCAMLTLFYRFGTLEGWTLPQVALLYGMIECAFALSETFARGFDEFSNVIRDGEFDRILLRPRGTWLQILAQKLYLRCGRWIQGVGVLGWAAFHLGLGWEQGVLLAAAIVGGACTFMGLLVLLAVFCFWTIEGLEVMNVAIYGGLEASRYPLSIYKPWIRRAFTYGVPLAFANYLPAQAIFGSSEMLGLPVLAGWVAPVVGLVFLGISGMVWRVGVRKYQSTGS